MTESTDNARPVADKPSTCGPATPVERNPSHQKPKNMNGPLYMQSAGNSNIVLVRRPKRQNESHWRAFARWMVENQIGLAFNLIALLFLAHFFIPRAQPHTRKFFTLANRNPNSGEYANSSDDAYLITFFVVLYTGLRAATMEYVLAPIAKLFGVRKTKDLTRFSEQSWLLCYYSFFWPLGIYLYCSGSYYLDMRGLWVGWPDREITGLMKFYILAQWAFWLQQIVVIHIEERRKDHWQMLSHHFITSGLISSCYVYHHTRVGNLILVLMDVVDIFFPLAKCLKYTGFNTLCDIMFGLFMASWIVARHGFYMVVCWSIYAHTPEVITYACFRGTKDSLEGPLETPDSLMYLLQPFYDSQGLICYNDTVKWAFLMPLLMLQCITIAWFTLIIRVAAKVLRGDGAEDNRSDDEGEEGEDEEYVYEEAQPLESEVGVEDLDLKGWERRSGVRRQASSSGVSLPGHSDRKELLGRIGCEKQVE